MPQINDSPAQGGGNYVYLPGILTPAQWQAMLNAGYNSGQAMVPASVVNSILEQYGLSQSQADANAGGITFSISGGGSGGYGGPSPADLRNLRHSFLAILHAWDIDVNKNMERLVDRGVDQLWSTTTFMNMLRRTKDYKINFPGINSQPGMDEGEYLNIYRNYRQMSQDIGYNLDKATFGLALKKGVDPQEYMLRVNAIDRINKDKALFSNFVDYMKQGGWIKPGATVKKKELGDLIMGRGSPQFEKAWERASFETGLEQAGFVIGKGKGTSALGLSRREMFSIIKHIESTGAQVEAAGPTDWVQLYDLATEVMPLSQIYKAGITKSDLIEMKFGGPKAPEIAKRVNQLLSQEQSFWEEQRADRDFVVTEGGHTSLIGTQKRQQQTQ